MLKYHQTNLTTFGFQLIIDTSSPSFYPSTDFCGLVLPKPIDIDVTKENNQFIPPSFIA
ncbi:hypothetical protein [Shewanella surugensis]|uniref:Uncharacterized protein n=1 Tax=Shewanella surugensis TaxID=212020 RepID=A0ABT0LH76_9GAMM|nr:hypothetical protein [Shewanella surugensis]MCL1127025.1 hypothetical protein [Shewanella surugensis]